MPDLPLLDPATINQAEALGVAARYIVEGYLAGEHKSPFRGFSIEFTQHREYVAGDDPRHIDWKVFARTRRLYLKQYEQETNFVCHVLVDGSESMFFGGAGCGLTAGPKVSKLDYAKMMAACLCYVILHQRDAVSLTLFDDATRTFIPRTGNLASIHNIMKSLADFKPTQTTNIGQALHALAGTATRRGLVVLISDLFDDEEQVLSGIQHLRFIGHEVIVFHTLDLHEMEFPFKGMVEFDGLEMNEKLLTRAPEIRKSYLAEFNAFCDKVREGCEKNRCDYLRVNTATPLHETISGYLGFRHRTSLR
jgi:uncharacterized protein (DUF58 family)